MHFRRAARGGPGSGPRILQLRLAYDVALVSLLPIASVVGDATGIRGHTMLRRDIVSDFLPINGEAIGRERAY